MGAASRRPSIANYIQDNRVYVEDWEKRFGDKLLFIDTCKWSFKLVRNQCSGMTVSESWAAERAERSQSR